MKSLKKTLLPIAIQFVITELLSLGLFRNNLALGLVMPNVWLIAPIDFFGERQNFEAIQYLLLGIVALTSLVILIVKEYRVAAGILLLILNMISFILVCAAF